MASFDSYFSQKNIISELVKIRVNEAKKRNDAYFYKKLNKYARDPSDMYKITVSTRPTTSFPKDEYRVAYK